MLFILTMAFNSSFAQTTIKGVVTGDSGEELIGANIIVKGTSDGTVSDVDGSYTVKTSQSLPLTLVFSYTGYASQEVEVTKNEMVNVTLLEGILGDEVVISASRRREKVQEAPASISVLSSRKLEASANSTDATRNLINLAGVQIQQQSANRINISMRGDAGLFGTSVFPIMDYRSLVGAGIGTFQTDQAGISNIDLERIEVVRGPGSALYGPGVTQGVVHFITKSPIDKPGTTVEVMGGELNTFGFGVRHGTKISDKFGFKVNASYKRGNEFTLDPNDPDDALQIAKFKTQIVQPAVANGIVDPSQEGTVIYTLEDLDPDQDGNPMSNEWNNLAVNATLEFRPKDDLSIVASGGLTDATSVFYNEQGEGLAHGIETWGQVRMQAGGLFAQVFGSVNDGGKQDNPTFLYQTGNRTPLGRQQLEAQVQYNFDLEKVLNSNWTAGIDYRFAGQDTENLVYGRNEDDDNFSLYGAYVQGKFKLHDKVDMVLAGRYDQFNFIDEGAFSPRAALVYKVAPTHTVRASFNRANSTVSNLQLNIDFPLSVVTPTFDIWLYGNKTTQTFENAATGWLLPVPTGLNQLPLGVAFGAVTAPTSAALSAGLLADPATAPLEPLISGLLAGVDLATLGLFSGPLSPGYNIFDGSPLGLVDAPVSAISTHDNWEIGYKGLIKNKLGVSLDIYNVTQRNNSQFTAISPAYKLTNLDALGGELGAAVTAQIEAPFIQALLDQGFTEEQATGTWLAFQPAIAGAYAAGGGSFASSIDALPFHATTPTDQVPDNGVTHLAAGYRTFDERSFLGMDLGLEYYFTQDISAFFNYSWVNRNEFEQRVVGFEDSAPLPTYLNIPKNKFRVGVNYTPEKGIRGSLTYQHDDSYFASAGQFSGDTSPRNLVDASVGYRLDNGIAIDISATNLLNNKYRYLPNMPFIGRRALAKVTYSFGYDKE